MDKADLFLINAVYRATEGEGIFVGSPQIFVRYQGCHIGCVNCDSKDTWAFEKTQEKTWEELLKMVIDITHQYPLKRLSITGGDPLHPKFESGVVRLAHHFRARGFFVNVEASGQKMSSVVFDSVDYISFDYKTPSTQVRGRVELVIELAKKFPKKFQIKSVAQDLVDFEDAWQAYQKVKEALSPEQMNFPWVLTPAFNPGETVPRERMIELMQANDQQGGPFRIIGQQHKFIYGPDLKNV